MIKIYRLEQTDQGALGALVIDGIYFCSTLEPDANDPDRNQIPAGAYKCRRFHGTKYPDTYEIIVQGHTAVLFHPGNIEEDSLMCILLGQYPGKLKERRAVLNSGATFKEFMMLMNWIYPKEFDLIIINCFS